MAASTRKSETSKPASDQVAAKLMDGTYDRMLEAFEAQMEDAAATLRRALAAMKAENTLRS